MSDSAIVLLHGGHHGSWCWAPLLETLRERGFDGPLLALDVPGCGTKRGRATAQLDLAAIAAELNEDVRAQGLHGTLLVGHSMAGIVLPLMVAAGADLYREACFLATSVPREGQSIVDLLGRAERGRDPTRVGWPLPPDVGMARLFQAMFAPDMTPEQIAWVMGNAPLDLWPAGASVEPASRVGFPGPTDVSYIVTQRDPILPAAWQGRFAERVGAQRLYLLDTPHEPFITHPQALADLLIQVARRADCAAG